MIALRALAAPIALASLSCGASPARAPSPPREPAPMAAIVEPARATPPIASDAPTVTKSAAPSPCAPRPSGTPSAISADGSLTAYVVLDGTRTVATAVDDAPASFLCVARRGEGPRVLVASRAAEGEEPIERTLANFDNLVFAPDGRTLYFTSSAWVTSGAAHAVDVATGAERFLVDGQVVAVLTAGPYAGNLLALHYRLDDAHPVDSPDYRGRMDMWSVIRPSGELVRRLPDDEAARQKALHGAR